MKKSILIILLLSLVVSVQSNGQTKFSHKPKNAKTLKILGVNSKLHIEEHSSSEIVVQTTKTYTKPEDSKGLTLITTGREDNTGIGLNIAENEGVVKILSASKKRGEYKILIPKNMKLVIKNKSVYARSVHAKNLTSEIEIKRSYGDVKLEGVTGPVILNTTYGKAHVIFSKVNQKKPSSIISPYGKVDVSIPASTKANLKLSSPYGDIYTDLKIDYKKSGDGEWASINSKEINGKINGGGVEMHLSSSYKNIYLRKK